MKIFSNSNVKTVQTTEELDRRLGKFSRSLWKDHCPSTIKHLIVLKWGWKVPKQNGIKRCRILLKAEWPNGRIIGRDIRKYEPNQWNNQRAGLTLDHDTAANGMFKKY